MDSKIAAILNSLSFAALIGLLIKAFSLGKTVGKDEAITELMQKEITTLRVNSHKNSNEIARLSAKDEVRTVRQLTEGRVHDDDDP